MVKYYAANDETNSAILKKHPELVALVKLKYCMDQKTTPKEKLDACKSFVTESPDFKPIISSHTEPTRVLGKLAEFFRKLFTKKDSLEHQKNMKTMLTTIKSPENLEIAHQVEIAYPKPS